MFILIVGCGRLGAALAVQLVKEGHRVTIVDDDPGSFLRLPPDTTVEQVIGTGIDIEVLTQAGVSSADALLAVTDRDNSNMLIAEMADRLFHVPQVVARIADPAKEEFFRRTGVPSICPTALAAGQVMAKLRN